MIPFPREEVTPPVINMYFVDDKIVGFYLLLISFQVLKVLLYSGTLAKLD